MKFKPDEKVEVFSRVTQEWHTAVIRGCVDSDKDNPIYDIRNVQGVQHVWHRCDEKRIRKIKPLESEATEL